MDTEVLETTIDVANGVLGGMWAAPSELMLGRRDGLTHRVAAMVSARTGCNDPIGAVRSASYPVTLVLGGTGDQDIAEDWMVESTAGWLNGSQAVAWHRPESLPQTAIDALCYSQGTNLEDVVNSPRDEFSRSMAEELREARDVPGCRLCVLATMDWETLLDCTMCSCYPDLVRRSVRPVLCINSVERPVVGLFDPTEGRSSRLGVELARPVEVLPSAIEAAMIERVSGEPVWGEERGMRWLTPGCTLDGRVADLFGARAHRCENDAMGIRR